MTPDLFARPTASKAAPRRDPWQLAWRVATSHALLASALAGLALLLFLAAWLPQSPAALPEAGNLPVYSRWLALVQRRFGPASGLLQTLGLFSISNTVLLRALIGLAGCALATRWVDYAQDTWSSRIPPAPPEHAQAITLARPLAETVAALHRARWRVVDRGDYAVADGFPLAQAARLLAASGGLVFIIGLGLASGRWRAQISVGAGEAAPIGPNTPYSLRLDHLEENATGRITLLRETAPVATGALAPGRAAYVAGLAVHTQAVGPAVRASATISDDQPVNLLASATDQPAGELLLRLTPNEPDRFFAMPDIGLLARIRQSPPSSSFGVSLYRTRTGEILFEETLPPDGIVRAGNVTLKFKPERYASLAVTHDPGTWPMLIGWLLGALGVLGAWIRPVRRLWLRATSDGRAEVIDSDVPMAASAGSDDRARRAMFWGLPMAAALAWLIVSVLSIQNLIAAGHLWPEVAGFKIAAGSWLILSAACLVQRRPAGLGRPYEPGIL